MKSELLMLNVLNTIIVQNKFVLGLLIGYLESLGVSKEEYFKKFEEELEFTEKTHKALNEAITNFVQ
jgi:hypothetical protein